MARYNALRIVVLILAFPCAGLAQEHAAGARPPVPAPLTVLNSILVPKWFADCDELRAYIRSDEFLRCRRACGDLCAVDEIYDRALRLCWNNVGIALLVSAFATMDHRRVGVDVPILGPLVWLPLTSEFEGEFRRRVASLPSRLYPDTPPGPGGDRDKLQHFFGSAFLAYVTESGEGAERVGDFVEWGEGMFIVGGVNDPRDQRANRQGRAFGLRLLRDDAALPSDELLSLPFPPTPAIVTAGAGDTVCSVLEER